MVAPVGAAGLDEVGRDDLPGVELDDGYLVVAGEREDALVFVRGTASEVVHAAAAAKAHLPVDIDAVVAQAVAPSGAWVG